MWCYQGFGIPVKSKYSPKAGGSIFELAKDLRMKLSSTQIGGHLNILVIDNNKLIIKGDLPVAGLGLYLRNMTRKIKDRGKPAHRKTSDFHMIVSIDGHGAKLNLHNSSEWKFPLYDIVLETVKHD